MEEIPYRGYAVERLTTLVGRPWLGGALAVAAFARAHIPFWGFGPAIAANIPVGAVMVMFYLWKRDLVANAIAHRTVGLVSLASLGPAA